MAGGGKERDLLRLARSACHLALFKIVSARLRSVTSSMVISISRRRPLIPRIFLGTQQQHARRRQVDLDFIILYGVLGLEQMGQRAFQVVVADVSEVLANRLLRNDVEGTIEGAVDRDSAQLLVEYDQGLDEWRR